MNYLAVDLGASGGKVHLGRVREDAIYVSEIYRFDNQPIERDGKYVWDVERLVEHVERGIKNASERVSRLDSVGVATWGLDFGLLSEGELLAPPYSYRDPKVVSTREDAEHSVGRRTLFEETGIANWNTPNTVWQYHYLATEQADLLDRCDRVLMMPQLVSYLLGGDPCCEETIASTTQLLDPETRTWATSLLDDLGLPVDPLPDVRPPGTPIGTIRADLARLFENDPAIVLPASHDTASAVAGLPLSTDSRAFLSAGTWFLCGVELDEPNRSDAAFESGASNELGIEGTVRFLRNVTGFFLLEECRAAWEANGEGEYSYDRLLDEMAASEPFGPLINPDDPAFDIEADMPDAIATYCRETDQPVPKEVGTVTRCVVESLATKTAVVLEKVLDAADVESEALHVGGGGVYNEPFCRMLAGAVERPVVAGPAEATATGNVLSQALASGELSDLDSARELAGRHLETETYDPEVDDRWRDARERMGALCET